MADTFVSIRALSVLLILGFLAGCASTSRNASQPSQPPQTVAVSVTPQTAYVGAGQTTQFAAAVTGTKITSVTWAVNGTAGGNSTVGTIDANGDYSAPSVTQNITATVTATSTQDATKSASAAVSVMEPGVVTTTNEPQVAKYTIDPPAAANVSIEFGTDTSYGRSTWTQTAPAGGGPVSIYVAGMLANTLYHMRAVVRFTGSNSVDDIDHTFTTSSFPANELPVLSASTTAGMTPQSGVELLDFFDIGATSRVAVAVTDLAGNLLWGFAPNLPAGYGPNPVKLLPNGDFLLNLNGQPDGSNSLIEEVDLGGNIVWQMNAAQLNQALAAATCAGCNVTVIGTHHDFAVLPNGHIILIAATQQVIGGTTVTGDVLIELDQNHKPVWLWNEFDHLDVNRHPYMWPDWTHTNAIVYSPSDGDLIVSMRHQSWIIKIDYNNGNGTGNILWRLGYQGDFTLMNGTDPVDWFYAQHDVNVISSNSSGTFQVGMFDNGNDRVMDSNGDLCGASGQPPCYSRAPILQLDEAAKTATIQWVDNLSPVFSIFGGSVRLLANGNIEVAECDPTAGNPAIYEMTETTPPETVWQMQVSGQPVYRGTRIPSLYPGVQW
jgi:arylsulfate sulfotransferase